MPAATYFVGPGLPLAMQMYLGFPSFLQWQLNKPVQLFAILPAGSARTPAATCIPRSVQLEHQQRRGSCKQAPAETSPRQSAFSLVQAANQPHTMTPLRFQFFAFADSSLLSRCDWNELHLSSGSTHQDFNERNSMIVVHYPYSGGSRQIL